MADTWYLAVDMQLYFLSPLFIFPLWRWPRKIGPALVLLGLSVSIFYTVIIHLKWDVPLVFMITRAYNRFFLFFLLFESLILHFLDQ